MAVEMPPIFKGYVMEDGYVTYQNRAVPRAGFRAFIYAKNGDRMLVNSWDEFSRYINSNEWFSTEDEAKFALQEENKQELFTVDEIIESEKIIESLTNGLEQKRRGRKPKHARK